MKRKETAQEIRRLLKQADEGFPDHESYMCWASEAAPLVAHDVQMKSQFSYYLQFAANEALSSTTHQNAYNQLRSLLYQAASELEREPQKEEERSISVSYHDLWAVARALTLGQWLVVASAAGTIFAAGFRCAQTEFFQGLYQLMKRLGQ